MESQVKSKKVLTAITVFLLLLTIIGVSYAVWRISLQQTESNRISTACFDVSFTEDSEAIQLEKAYPILDEEGMTGTPYTFTLTNNCDGYASYQINLEVLNETTLDSKYIKAYLDSSSPSILSDLQVTSTTLDEATTAYILNTGYFEPSESKTFNLRIWMDENTPALEETMNKTFASKVTITTSYLKNKPSDYEICVSKYGEDSIQCSILANLDETDKCPTVNEDGTVVVNSAEATDGYVCSAPDDYGTSYYFRGAVENNWVKFANSYWRIIRINGDDSIRMIYAGDASVIDALPNKEEVLKNGYNDGDTDYTQIGESAFNSSSNDNAYVGYMYGTRSASTYEDTHANTNNSAIKIKVDEWYEAHLKGKEYESYLSDTLFCNDRSFNESNTGTGAGTSETDYRPNSGNKTLKCSKKNDRFTVDDEEIGNGALTYPISLITGDEVYLAGGYARTNSSYYLYTGNYYWTLSPSDFGDYGAFVRSVFDNGNAGSSTVSYSYGVRPVINLKAGSLKMGSGTATDPYTVE